MLHRPGLSDEYRKRFGASLICSRARVAESACPHGRLRCESVQRRLPRTRRSAVSVRGTGGVTCRVAHALHRLLRQWEDRRSAHERSLKPTDLHPADARAPRDARSQRRARIWANSRDLLTPLKLGDIGNGAGNAPGAAHAAAADAGSDDVLREPAPRLVLGRGGKRRVVRSRRARPPRPVRRPHSGARLGRGRLAYDLQTRLAPAVTVALDINPLLSLATQRIANGARIDLHEFPLAPRRLEDVAVRRELTAPAPARAGFHCVLADGLRAPFVADAFDAVVTPWFVDIVDEDLRGARSTHQSTAATGRPLGDVRFAAIRPRRSGAVLQRR